MRYTRQFALKYAARTVAVVLLNESARFVGGFEAGNEKTRIALECDLRFFIAMLALVEKKELKLPPKVTVSKLLGQRGLIRGFETWRFSELGY